MDFMRLFGKKPLWAEHAEVDEQTLPLWRAAIYALGIEIIVPFLIFGIDWSFLPSFDEPPPLEVMQVRLEEPPPEQVETPPPPPKKKPKAKKQKPRPVKQVKNVTPIVPPKPLPNEVPSNIQLPKPQPKPKPVKKKEEPQPELPPLPSVFRDVKPVRKVKPKYPREAEDKLIEGRVKVRLSVDLDGTVSKVEILLSEPPGVFDEEVLKAVKKYQFKRDGTTHTSDQLIIFIIDPPQ
jgi:TonB family protein